MAVACLGSKVVVKGAVVGSYSSSSEVVAAIAMESCCLEIFGCFEEASKVTIIKADSLKREATY